MLVISRKNGQKIIINDDIIISVVETRNGQCKLAIEADKNVKIYREEIYYQIKLANLVGKDTDVNAVASVSNLINKDGGSLKLNDKLEKSEDSNEVIVDNKEKTKKIIIKKQDKNIL